MEDLGSLLVFVAEDEHLSSASLALLDSLDEECSEFVALVLFYEDDSGLLAFGAVEESHEGSAVAR